MLGAQHKNKAQEVVRVVHVFEFYRKELQPLAEKVRSVFPPLLRVEREVRGLTLPEGEIILDLETTGLNSWEHEMVSYGIVSGSKAWVVIRLNGSEEELIRELRRDLESLGDVTIWAFYAPFEEAWLVEKLEDFGAKLDVRDLKVMKGRLSVIVPFSFNDPFEGSSIPRLWENWRERASLGSIAGIIHHNMADILREAFLWALLQNMAFDVETTDYLALGLDFVSFEPPLHGEDDVDDQEG